MSSPRWCTPKPRREQVQSHLYKVVSEDGKHVKRLQPFNVEEVQSRIVVAEKLPDDQKHQTLMKIFSAVGNVKSIRTCYPQDISPVAANRQQQLRRCAAAANRQSAGRRERESQLEERRVRKLSNLPQLYCPCYPKAEYGSLL
ncbi:La-related protein 6B [Zea mays]|uniref:La-related protein 6B n=1 Tax=Zea mays TaxID=4577 RepID=A0A3L6G614_MAIZE|nr:La-related protein 6B [Zea mays]